MIDLVDIPDLFHRSRHMDVLERLDNHVVLGAKGSGKSTVLRALTLLGWGGRSPRTRLPFAGVHVPMAFKEVSVFRTAYEEAGISDLFEHFFVASVLSQFLQQFAEATIALDIALLLPTRVQQVVAQERLTTLQAIERLIGDRYTALEGMQADRQLRDVALAFPVLTLSAIAEVAERYSAAAMQSAGLPTRLGLLLDSFDYYGALGSAISPLLQSDSAAPLTWKLAARTLRVDEILSTQSRGLEERRDYHILSLDRDNDDTEHALLVRDAICRRTRKFGPQEVAELADDAIMSILFGDSPGPEDLASFHSFCQLSSGNILTVILLLDKAAELQRAAAASPPGALTSLQRPFRLEAVNQLSTEFWEREIGVRIPVQKLEASTFCEAALERAREVAPSNNGSPRFSMSQVDSEKSLVANMLATRVLVATDDTTNRRVQAGFDVTAPLTFDLNRLLLPARGRLPAGGSAIELDRQRFGELFKRMLRDAKPHLSPRATRPQADLFRHDFTVFISVPFDPAKRGRTKVVRKAINRIYRELTHEEGGEGKSFVDVHYLPQTGPFRSEIPNYIRDSSYVVADISDILASPDKAPGVFYEIGLSVGESKPVALFVNERDGNHHFAVDLLPPVLRGETVLVYSHATANFHNAYKRVHEKLIALNGTLPPSVSMRSQPTAPYAYLSMQSRHADAKEFFTAIIRELFPELLIRHSREWTADDLSEMIGLVQGASLAIVDCTEHINERALELGVAATAGRNRVLEVWNSGVDRTPNPVAMFPYHKWSWTDLGSPDRRQAIQVLQDIGRSTQLGRRRT